MKGQINLNAKEEFKIKKEEEEIKEEKEEKEEKEKKKEEKKEEEGKRVVKNEEEILDYKFYDRDKINNFIKCTNIFTIENLFNQYKNNFEFDVIEISDINSKKKEVAKFIKNKKKKEEGYVFDIICKEEESGKYRNYIIYTNKIVNNFFENNKCIIYVDCLYAKGDNINTTSMFSECTNLLFVDISKIKMENLYGTFYSCKNLKYVFLPDKVQEIECFSFYNCDNLKLVINIKNCSNYSKNNNFNTSEKLLFFMATKEQSEDKNELKCKYFDSSNNFHKDFYPTNNSSYIITNNSLSFIEYVNNGYSGKFLIPQKDISFLKKEVDTLIKKQEEEKNKEKEKKEEKKTPWEKGIFERRIKTFEEFNFDKDDFDIVKNENEEEVKAVDQIFYKFVQDEIKDVDNRLIRNMEEWNNRDEKEKTYENFKNVFVFDYKRKNLFVPELDVQNKNKIIE